MVRHFYNTGLSAGSLVDFCRAFTADSAAVQQAILGCDVGADPVLLCPDGARISDTVPVLPRGLNLLSRSATHKFQRYVRSLEFYDAQHGQ